MDNEQAALIFEKLGHPTRLAVLQLLVQAGEGGMTVGALQDRLQVPASTLSHHISHLSQGALLNQERDGRTRICRANYATVEALVRVLTERCCAGFTLSEDRDTA
jgi:DNA-binding transcriptional ArsR family regulator